MSATEQQLTHLMLISVRALRDFWHSASPRITQRDHNPSALRKSRNALLTNII